MRNIQDETNLNQKKVLLRLDLNVPLDNGKITDTTRIDKILPTINFLLKNEAKIIILSHVGRPNGKVVKIISYEKILNFFFEIHDPTTLNSQGPDFGTQYRSEIFYLNDKQKEISESAIEKMNSSLSGKVVTKSSLLKNYCPAEEYHQRYLEKR